MGPMIWRSTPLDSSTMGRPEAHQPVCSLAAGMVLVLTRHEEGATGRSSLAPACVGHPSMRLARQRSSIRCPDPQRLSLRCHEFLSIVWGEFIDLYQGPDLVCSVAQTRPTVGTTSTPDIGCDIDTCGKRLNKPSRLAGMPSGVSATQHSLWKARHCVCRTIWIAMGAISTGRSSGPRRLLPARFVIGCRDALRP